MEGGGRTNDIQVNPLNASSGRLDELAALRASKRKPPSPMIAGGQKLVDDLLKKPPSIWEKHAPIKPGYYTGAAVGAAVN